MDVPLKETLERLSAPYRAKVGGPRARAVAGLLVLFLVIALLVARGGTASTRVLAIALLGLGVVIAGLARLHDRWIDGSPARTLKRVAGRVEPREVERAVRAVHLVEARRDGTSDDLARLFLAQRLAAISPEAVSMSARRASRAFAAVAVLLAIGSVAACGTGPWRVVEGADVLASRGGKAPVPLAYLTDVTLSARPPEYLHENERHPRPRTDLALAKGTLLSFSGRPIHEDRRLALSDGTTLVPFVDDGSGRVVARWSLMASADLRVVARFGGVVIEEPDPTPIHAVVDSAPEVILEGAPRTIKLATDGPLGEIAIRYDAKDDHGLREIHLVLRAGAKDERRVLSRLNGATQRERGGYALRLSDPFIKKSHAPVEIRVEARDNDTVSGPKWGKSEAITVIPPRVGEPEALRLAALRQLRDALVDSLAARMSRPVPPRDPERRAFVTDEWKGIEEDREHIHAVTSGSYAGSHVPSRLAALFEGQIKKLSDAGLAAVKAPSKETHEKVVHATEELVLVTDAMIAGLGQRDTKDAAKELAPVADDLAAGALEAEQPAAIAAANVRMDAAKIVLEGGAESMMELGWLGHDIGEIVTAYLPRVTRSRDAKDFLHAELAARDLAARLRQPDPSFGAKGASGGGGGGGGTESGGTPGPESEAPSPAEQAFNEAAQDLDRLASDHAGQMGKLDQALSIPPSSDEMKRFSDEARKHAARVREAAQPLPSVGGGSDSWTSKGAAAKENAEQMARSLEQGSPDDAVTSGKSALGALDEARRQAARDRWMFGDAERRIEDARKKLEAEVAWAEQALAEMKKRAADRARPELGRQGDEEGKLAERAKALGERGKKKAGLPDRAIEALEGAEEAARSATRALKKGDAEQARRDEREVQQRLEAARDALGRDQPDDDNGGSGHADIPKADAHKGPDDLRQRVMKGLGSGGSGSQKDAVRRYAEGLLR